MDLVWLGMPEGHLPTPGNLTGEEVELILDPSASGVPELSPVLTMRRRIEASEKRVKELEGEEGLVAKSMLACSLAHFDTPRAIMLVEEVLDAAKANDADRFSPDSQTTQRVFDLKPLPVAAPHNVIQINQTSTDRYH